MRDKDKVISALPECSLLDAGKLPILQIADLSMRESARPRSVYQAHKWFARRFAVTARSLLVAAASPLGTNFWRAYYGQTSCENLAVLDPFMGGGVMLLEAARLGSSVFGVDVEPVAAVVSDFQGRMWDLPTLKNTLAALKKSVGERLAPFYKCRDEDGNPETLLHAFWVQVVRCGHCRSKFDAHPTFRFAWNEAQQWVACHSCSRVLHGNVSAATLSCKCGKRTSTKAGRCEHNAATCPNCKQTEPLIAYARREGRPVFRIFAVETIPSEEVERRHPNTERRIRTVTKFDIGQYNKAAKKFSREGLTMPKGAIPKTGRSDGRLLIYGYNDYSELFNARQQLHLHYLATEIANLEGPIRDAMIIAFSDHLTTNNMLCGYAGGWRRLSPLFAIRAYRHIARPVEINPWLAHNGRGTFPNAVRAVENAAISLRSSVEPTLSGPPCDVPPHRPRAWDVRCGDARDLRHIKSASIDLVLTDPPYFDYISYSELGHFFVPWLVRLGLIDSQHLEGFPTGQLAARGRSKLLSEVFGKSLATVMTEVARVCKRNGRIVFTYQNLDGRGWAALASAMATAGVLPLTVFPMFGDGSIGLHKHEKSISWDCVVVCKPGKPLKECDLSSGEKAGKKFMLSWAQKLKREGHELSLGDLANLRYAGTLLEALREKGRLGIAS